MKPKGESHSGGPKYLKKTVHEFTEMFISMVVLQSSCTWRRDIVVRGRVYFRASMTVDWQDWRMGRSRSQIHRLTRIELDYEHTIVQQC